MIKMFIGTREDRGKAIAEKAGQIIRINDNSYKVKSQSSETLYDVKSTEIGWKCNCPDHTSRGVQCKHIFSVLFSFAIRKEVEKVRIEPVVSVSSCVYCHSTNVIKYGVRHNKYGDVQLFHCNDCSKHYTLNLGFEKMKASPKTITVAMQLYFSGESLRNVAESLKLLGVKVSHVAVYNWIEKYTNLMKQYMDKLKPNVGDTWRADEVFVKFSGNMKYLFALMDDETRYWIAQEVADTKFKHDAQGIFHEGKEITGKRPNVLITDGLPAYHDAFNREFYQNTSPRSKHINAIKLDGDMNNNKMERINGEIRDREKVMRGLKEKDTPILQGMQIYHNFVRPHEALNGKTPAEACGIEVVGENKWITLIQNARLDQQER
ncbi:MAG: DDE-type integrase/transposase/recombinase [Candidatus Methanoperedens sp.]|nr:DDE-type integrase/transposase/recombinase [Candidatus Methanoperedens sp.]